MPGRKEYRGASGVISLNGSLGASATSCQADGNVAGWPTGVTYPFVIRIDAGTISEEKILCTSLTSGTPNTIAFAQRGYDGTTAATHSPGAPVQHCEDADSFDTFADHTFNTARDDHLQYIRTDGTRPFTGLGAMTGPPVPVGTANQTGTAATLARSDHVHDIADGAIDHATIIAANIITGTQIADNSIGAGELAPNAVDTIAIQVNAVTNARIADNAVTNSKLADNAVDTPELATGAVTPAKLAPMPCCRLRKAAVTNIPAGVFTAIGFTTESFDTDTMHDNVTNNTRITFKTTGVYQIGGAVQWDADPQGSARAVHINLNGSTVIASVNRSALANETLDMSLSALFRFTAGDYIELLVRQNSSGTLAVNGVLEYSPCFWTIFVSS